ncbi:hypothetical protein CDCA_CDCA04G1158 [Cyanidium caldarium]|uniref:Fibronectin type-III domain-containing protein n=1 Tax=Cyanidium caldarium TaxID=2771 RepID=A0AAV9ISS3_CYACA|nr:hypothetical protein CDCA_CDCA04G1158 [Cyanidium caldarium]
MQYLFVTPVCGYGRGRGGVRVDSAPPRWGWARVRSARRIVCRMQADGEEIDAGDDDGGERIVVKEPYPGYYNDMARMGIDRAEAEKQLRAKQMSKRPSPRQKIGGKASLYRPDGTPYAPWMIGVVNEDATPVRSVQRRSDARGRLAGDPQAQEISGVGLRARPVGDGQVELRWSTGDEANNVGFQISRRQGGTTEWEMVADYRSAPAQLKSQGVQGGAYRYIDRPPPGTSTWVYRVSDADAAGNVSDLSQTLVEIVSSEDRKRQTMLLVGLIGVMTVVAAVAYLADPI